eukprot:gene29674-36986_t
MAEEKVEGNVIAQLVTSDGESTGPQLDLPPDLTHEQLEALLNELLTNEEKVPYAFFVNDLELTGHKNHVLVVSFSPDGKQLVSGSMDKDVRLWCPKTGKARGLLKGHREWITSLAWEPAHLAYPSRRVASASRDTTIKGHGHWVNTMALSTEHALRTGPYDHNSREPPEDPEEAKQIARARYDELRGGRPERMVSGSDDFTMFLWEPNEDKKHLARMTGHVQLINQVQFSPNGQWIVSASFDKSVKLWDGATGKFITSFFGHIAPVYQ